MINCLTFFSCVGKLIATFDKWELEVCFFFFSPVVTAACTSNQNAVPFCLRLCSYFFGTTYKKTSCKKFRNVIWIKIQMCVKCFVRKCWDDAESCLLPRSVLFMLMFSCSLAKCFTSSFYSLWNRGLLRLVLFKVWWENVNTWLVYSR